ncbi:MAG: isoleucine--tRNA ligase [SAR324 cluster bacterium]|nr:isoleucine--tRNA ligase [SAR324 cluster bacterium]
MKEVSSKVSFPDQENSIRTFWQENQIFKKSVEQRPNDKQFVFYDGPPFATGLPHYGHLLAGTIKDVIPRYKTMKGFRVERRFGWDCHGLPVEFEMEKKLNLNGRSEIEKFGIDRFNEECRSIVLRYTNEWRSTVERMGRWVDFDNDYKTMDRSFMETVWWVFNQLWKKGWIYEGFKVLPYSWRVSTPVSNFEANLNYKDVQDPSVTLRFKVLDEENAWFLAWTTTPWTLPSNLALCVGPVLPYVKLLEKSSQSVYYLCKTRIPTYFEEGTFEILDEFPGTALEGRRYEPLFTFAQGKIDTQQTWRILSDGYVSDDSGTGIVHQAPAFGEDDLRICQKAGLPVFDPVDSEGNFREFMGFIAGINIKEADKLIIRQLKTDNRLFRQETLQHSYPFCWRTDTPLIYKAISTWFVNVEAIKELMVANNQQINWTPGHIKDGRFGKWLENARDWAISRNRFWGTPLPIWKNEDGELLCFGSVSELEQACGKKIDDLHKHFIDDVVIERNGKTYRRVPEVLDCWFESGSMPYAQQHYPFERKDVFENNFPADFICEGLDQTRGWFYTLLVISTALFDKPAFRNVIVNGLVLAEDGKKMSKSLKNYPDPNHMLDSYGADAIRLYMLNSVAVKADDLKFSEKGVLETVRSILLPLWNSLSFLTTYAKIDGWQPTPENLRIPLNNPLDRWIRSRLHALIEDVGNAMDQYDLNRAVSPLVGFIDLLTNWYIRRSRRRFWKAGQGNDKLEAYATLYLTLIELSKMIAPFTPFLAESIYQNLKSDTETESVHLCEFPAYQPEFRDHGLEKKMDLILSSVSMGRALRSKHQLKIRQPLPRIFLITRDAKAQEILKDLSELITDELNIKEVVITTNEEELVHLSAKPNFRVLGPKLGKKMNQAGQQIANFDLATIQKLMTGQEVSITLDNEAINLSQDDVLIHRQEKEGLLVLTENNLTVALDTNLNEELLNEGYARELINKIQNMRKTQELDVMNRIEVVIQTSAILEKALSHYHEFIKSETLASNLESGSVEHGTEWDINGELCTVSIKSV